MADQIFSKAIVWASSFLKYFMIPITILLLLLFWTQSAPHDRQSTIDSLPRHVPLRHHSCKHCENIIVRADPALLLNHLVRLDHTVSQAYAAAADACPLFQGFAPGFWLRRSLWGQWQSFQAIYKPSSGDIHCFTGLVTWEDRLEYFLVGVSSRPFQIHFGVLHEEAGGTLYARLLHVSWKSFEMDVSADPTNPAAEFIAGRPVNSDVSSPASFQLARKWLYDCLSNSPSHSSCRDRMRLYKQGKFVPRRLIEITANEDATLRCKIVEPMQHEDWVCLSYCWGGNQRSKTTTNNINNRRVSFPCNTLPRTIQDALLVTYKLGQTYMWIDALCIVQDDPNDIAQELTTMAKVYQFAVLTISASRSRSSDDGFLHAREINKKDDNSVSIHYKCSNGVLGRINIAPRHVPYQANQEPINKRAWTFQERLLSPQVLDYGTSQLRWICEAEIRQDGGPLGTGSPGFDGYGGKGLSKLASESKSPNLMHKNWTDIVTPYTRRELSFPGDKLLAISAVAAAFAPIFLQTEHSAYLAGLWERDLPEQLAWSMSSVRKLPRPSNYRAPSWSWAAVDGRVDWPSDRAAPSPVDILDYQVDLKYSFSPFGAVKAAKLLLKGRMRRVKWFYNRSEVHLHINGESIVFSHNRKFVEAGLEGLTHFLCWAFLDAQESICIEDGDASLELWCLKLRQRTEKNGTRCIFLIEDVEDKNRYRRVGYLEIGDAIYRYDPPLKTDFFQDVDAREILLV